MPPVVLVVDDEPDVLSFVADVLAEDGINVLLASGPVTALECIAQVIPDLFIVDLRLPGLSGTELVALLRGGRLTPAIAISGSRHDVDELRAHGFTAVLPKPFTSSELMRVVRDQLPPAA